MEYTIEQLQKEAQKLDPGFTITPNPNRGAVNENKFGLNNIFYEGQNYDLPVVADITKDIIDPNYRYVFPNGYSSRCWSFDEIMARLKGFLEIKNSGRLAEEFGDNE